MSTLRPVNYADLNLCRKASKAIIDSDVLVICIGAGMSADSGLPVYNQIAEVEAYNKRKLTYADLCQPSWLEKDPKIFYGFWGKCFNDYQDKPPHKGYQSLLRIANLFNSPLGMDSIEKRFFIYSSNVDSMCIKAGFKSDEVNEIHGSCLEWHCSVPCEKKPEVWKLPEHYRFKVNVETMEAIGEFPKCGKCGALARPRVLMFSETLWIGGRGSSEYYRWRSKLEMAAQANRNLKIAILEVGCGKRIPTVRNESENYLTKYKNATLIRINPDWPDSPFPEKTIEIKSGAEDALTKIYRCILTKSIWENG